MAYETRFLLRSFRGRWSGDLVDSVHQGIVPVTSEGADTDLADNKEAFQRAADKIADGGALLIPPGHFRLSEFPKLPSNSACIGFGPPSRITFTKAIDIGITNSDHVNGNSNIYIGGLNLDGADLCNDPIELVNVTDGIVDHVWVTRGNHDGIELQSCTRCIISNCIAHDSNTFNGIELDGCNDCIVANCTTYNNVTGIEIDGTSDGCLIEGGRIRDNSFRGVSFSTNTTNNALTGAHISDNGTDVVDGGTDNSTDWTRGSNLHIANSNFKAGYFFQPAENAAPTDSNIPSRRFTFYLDEENNALKARARYSDGLTVKEVSLTLST